MNNQTELRILLVEDNKNDAQLTIREIEKAGYSISYSIVETEASLKVSLLQENWDVILLDFNIPRMPAIVAFKIIKSNNEHVPIIVVSGTVTEDIAIPIIEAGANDFVGKDKLFRLPLVIKREIRHSAELMRDRLMMESYQDQLLAAFGRALELRDHETQGHTIRVTNLAVNLAERSGHRDIIRIVHRGSLLHDIGKIGIPDAILLKPGKLTDEEVTIMRQHTTLAYEMLSNLPFLQEAINIPHYHHEHYDGSGYPDGLKGDKIPICARIFAIADTYDALTSDRPYRKAMKPEQAIEEMNRHVEYFDPTIYTVFLTLIRERAWNPNV